MLSVASQAFCLFSIKCLVVCLIYLNFDQRLPLASCHLKQRTVSIVVKSFALLNMFCLSRIAVKLSVRPFVKKLADSSKLIFHHKSREGPH